MCCAGISPMCVAIEMILRVCVQQIMNIDKRQVTTQDNVMLQQLHQRIFQEMVHQHCAYFINCCVNLQAFDVLLEAWSDLWN